MGALPGTTGETSAAPGAALDLDTRVVTAGGHVVAAVSGGADSMALLAVLWRFARSTGGTITAAHIDHGLRADSAADAARVGDYCHRLGVPFVSERVDVGERARTRGETVEEAARHERYAFLDRVRRTTGADTIATGHTRDDQVETVLMRLLRGTGLRGLRGIPRRRGDVVRPILHWRRTDTRAYCRSRAIPFADDPTNADRTFTRNAVRAELVPQLDRDFPGLTGRLVELARRADDLLTHVRETTEPILDTVTREGDGAWVLDLSRTAGLAPVARAVLLGDWLERIGVRDASRAHVAALEALCAPGAGSGASVSLPGATARREYDELVVRPRASASAGADAAWTATLPVPGHVAVAGWRLSTDVVAERPSPETLAGVGGGARPRHDNGDAPDVHVAFLGFSRAPSQLTVRSPRPGDRMTPFGMRGTKKLSDIWTDRKVPRRHRETAAVVEHDGEIVWLVGVATGERARVDENTGGIVAVRARRVEFGGGGECNE